MTEKQIKKLEAEAEIEERNTLYKDENFAFVKVRNGYFIRNLTDRDFSINIASEIEQIRERILVHAFSTTFFGRDTIGDRIAQKIIAHEFDIVYSHDKATCLFLDDTLTDEKVDNDKLMELFANAPKRSYGGECVILHGGTYSVDEMKRIMPKG